MHMYHTNLPALRGAGAGLLGLEVAGAFWEIRKMLIIVSLDSIKIRCYIVL